MMPTILIIMIARIIVAIRQMLIEILSVVIKDPEKLELMIPIYVMLRA